MNKLSSTVTFITYKKSDFVWEHFTLYLRYSIVLSKDNSKLIKK